MGEKTNISIILPIHKIDAEIKAYFENAIRSLLAQQAKPEELLIVIPSDNEELLKFVEDFNYGSIYRRIILNDGKTDFASQFNLGVKESKCDWVSLLEVDDVFSEIWIKNVVKYHKAYPEIGLFMPIILETNTNGEFIGFSNETVWASQFSDEMGKLDYETLLEYENFNFAGMVINKENIIDFGGVKSTIKLTFMYEFLLRMLNKGVIQMTIPKVGYQHTNQRTDSLFKTVRDGMDPVEAKWWLALAKRECHQTKEREVTYEVVGN